MEQLENKMKIFFGGNQISKVCVGNKQLFPELEYQIVEDAALSDVPDIQPIEIDTEWIKNFSKKQTSKPNDEDSSQFEKLTQEQQEQLSQNIHRMFTQQELEQGLDYQPYTPNPAQERYVCYRPSIYEDWIKTNAIVNGNTFMGFDEIKDAVTVVVPQNVDGTTLTKIGNKVFKGCINLEKVVLPSTIEKIGECAFMDCISLKDINLPNSLTAIEF